MVYAARGDAAHRDGQGPCHHLTCPVGDTTVPSCYRRGSSLGDAPPRRRAVVAQSFMTAPLDRPRMAPDRRSFPAAGFSGVGYHLATKPPETGRTRTLQHPRVAAPKWASPRRSGSAKVVLVSPRRGFVIDRSSVQVRSSAPVFQSLPPRSHQVLLNGLPIGYHAPAIPPGPARRRSACPRAGASARTTGAWSSALCARVGPRRR